MVLKVQTALKARKDRRVLKVHRDSKVQRARSDPKAYKEMQDPKASKVLLAILDLGACRALKVTMVPKDLRETKV